MTKMIFVNLPVADVAASTAFYKAIGMEQNMMFSNEQAAAMSWSDTINVMLLDHAFYATFTKKRIIDARTDSGALFALSFDNRDAVDAITRAALAAGGRELHDPEDMDNMYSRAFEDPEAMAGGRSTWTWPPQPRLCHPPNRPRREMPALHPFATGVAAFVLTALAILGRAGLTGTAPFA